MSAHRDCPSAARAAAAATTLLLYACGARSSIEALDTPSATTTTTTTPPPTCPDDAGVPAQPGCVLHAYDVNGADIGPTSLDLAEPPIDGYWVDGFNIAVYGGDGAGHSIQIWADYVASLGCGTTLSLSDQAILRWWGTDYDVWASTSGTLEVISFEPGTTLGPRPIHLEIHGAPMAPAVLPEGSAPNGATGTFTADLSCRLQHFTYVPSN